MKSHYLIRKLFSSLTTFLESAQKYSYNSQLQDTASKLRSECCSLESQPKESAHKVSSQSHRVSPQSRPTESAIKVSPESQSEKSAPQESAPRKSAQIFSPQKIIPESQPQENQPKLSAKFERKLEFNFLTICINCKLFIAMCLQFCTRNDFSNT